MVAGTNTNDLFWPKKKGRKQYRGIAAMVDFGGCEGILVAPTAKALRTVARGYYLTALDMKKTKHVTVERDK